MKVKELIQELQNIDPNREVIISRDAGGNNYSPLSSLWEGGYKAETTWMGEADDDGHGGVPAVILVPTY